MRRLALLGGVALAFFACAQQGTLRGAPEDHEAPMVVRISPESGSVNQRAKVVTFEFNEVVSERAAAQLFVVSPRDGEPQVQWGRTSIRVRPGRDWKPNTTYTITLLPGLTDLQANTRRTTATTMFSTGPTLATGAIRGMAFDWLEGRPAARAYVEAIGLPDSTHYVATADSLGGFTILGLPHGRFDVHATMDANGNRTTDPLEPWGSIVVDPLADSARVEILAFPHDTIPPTVIVVSSLAPRDSFSVRVTFDKPLSTTDSVPLSAFTITRADSTRVPLVQVRMARQWESEQAARAPVDTAAARQANVLGQRTSVTPLPTPHSPIPTKELVLTADVAFRPGSYRLNARAIQGLLGAPHDSQRDFIVQPPPPPAPARAGAGRGAAPP